MILYIYIKSISNIYINIFHVELMAPPRLDRQWCSGQQFHGRVTTFLQALEPCFFRCVCWYGSGLWTLWMDAKCLYIYIHIRSYTYIYIYTYIYSYMYMSVLACLVALRSLMAWTLGLFSPCNSAKVATHARDAKICHQRSPSRTRRIHRLDRSRWLDKQLDIPRKMLSDPIFGR